MIPLSKTAAITVWTLVVLVISYTFGFNFGGGFKKAQEKVVPQESREAQQTWVQNCVGEARYTRASVEAIDACMKASVELFGVAGGEEPSSAKQNIQAQLESLEKRLHKLETGTLACGMDGEGRFIKCTKYVEKEMEKKK